MPETIRIGGEEYEVFPEYCRKVPRNCFQCLVVESKAYCASKYTISSVAALVSCSVRTVWTAIRELGIASTLRQGHHRLLNAGEKDEVINHIGGKSIISVIFDRSSDTLKVTSSKVAQHTGLTREWIDRLIREQKVSGFVSGNTYVDAKAFDGYYSGRFPPLIGLSPR